MKHRVVRCCILFAAVLVSVAVASCKDEDEPLKPYEIQYADGAIHFTVRGASFTMIRVEGGTFEMGATSEQGLDDPDNNEYPVHTVTLSSYYICQTEVTQALWQAVMNDNPSLIHGNKMLPVDCVKWDMCQNFIAALNEILEGQFAFRMPSEAEWEFAARGGNDSQGYKYAGSNVVDEVAWYDANSDAKTHPVASKKPNELGLYDMSGNLWEWCSDWQGHYQPEAQTNPAGPDEGTHHVMRGGSWTYDATFCRVSRRNYLSSVIRASNCGLRLAMTPP